MFKPLRQFFGERKMYCENTSDLFIIGSEQKCKFSTRYIVEQHDRFVAATRSRTIDPRSRISRDTSRRSTSVSPFISSRSVPVNTLSLLSLTLSHSCSPSRFLSLLTFLLIIFFFAFPYILFLAL